MHDTPLKIKKIYSHWKPTKHGGSKPENELQENRLQNKELQGASTGEVEIENVEESENEDVEPSNEAIEAVTDELSNTPAVSTKKAAASTRRSGSANLKKTAELVQQTTELETDPGVSAAKQTADVLRFGAKHVVPESYIRKQKTLKKLGKKLEPGRLLAAEERTQFLTEQLSVSLGFTPESLRQLAFKLNPRIVVPVSDTEFFFDKILLIESFRGYLKEQQELAFLQQSRSVRAADRRYRIQREVAAFLEALLREDGNRKDELTNRVNQAFDGAHVHMKDNDILAYLESSRINEEKRRLRAELEEIERLAIEQLQEKL